MKILNDYSGHAFTVELARELAKRGHNVLHLSLGDFQSPKGDLAQAGRSQDLRSRSHKPRRAVHEIDFVARRRQEIEYGRRVTARIARWHPDVVIGCNDPLDPQRVIQNYCRACNICFVFWLQDIYSNAIKAVLRKKIQLLVPRSEFGTKKWKSVFCDVRIRSLPLLKISSRLLSLGTCRANASPSSRIGRQKEVLILPRDDAWSCAQDLNGKFRVMYLGNARTDHYPSLLVAAAEAFRPSRGRRRRRVRGQIC